MSEETIALIERLIRSGEPVIITPHVESVARMGEPTISTLTRVSVMVGQFDTKFYGNGVSIDTAFADAAKQVVEYARLWGAK